jgi:hypothetical protein
VGTVRNSVFVIKPYSWNGMQIFDDELDRP